jgi:hypothetical protein
MQQLLRSALRMHFTGDVAILRLHASSGVHYYGA